MGLDIAIGYEDFEEIRSGGMYYVDKTPLIYDLVQNTKNKVTLFTRPRRFGKTLNMSMLASFFDIRRDSRECFAGLEITKRGAFCGEWMNRYPVLSLSLKGVEALDYGEAFNTLQVKLADLCHLHAYLETDEHAHAEDRQVFRKFLRRTADLSETKGALKTIMRMMHAVYGKPVILLIDEYDVPLAKANENSTGGKQYYRKMLSLIRGLFDAALKTNEYLKFAVLAGCLRVSKESIFTGVNHFKCYGVLDYPFSPYFGFTLEEVREMLEAAGLLEKLPVVREWYDGYIFGDSGLFCPWDVSNYVAGALHDRRTEPQNFWINTSGNAILDNFINHPGIDVSGKFETLLNGGAVAEGLNLELGYDRLPDSEKNLWSVLLMTGYVTKAEKEERAGAGAKIKLRIPNKEIAETFQEVVAERFKKTLDVSKADAFLRAMWEGDAAAASDMLSEILWNSISYNDYAENYYHGILNGLFASRGYQIDSNAESGLGRLDLRIKDHPNRRCLVLELKRSSREAALEADCDAAIAQIKKKGYAKTLPPGYRQQICYGIACYAKMAMVKKA